MPQTIGAKLKAQAIRANDEAARQERHNRAWSRLVKEILEPAAKRGLFKTDVKRHKLRDLCDDMPITNWIARAQEEEIAAEALREYEPDIIEGNKLNPTIGIRFGWG